MLRVNLGCGHNVREDWDNIDYIPGPGIIQVDVEKEPLPYPDDTVDHILCSHMLEHLVYWERLMPEIHRVLKPTGTLEVRVPHTPNYTTGHIRQFDKSTMDGFIIEHRIFDPRGLDTTGLFHLVSRTINRRSRVHWHMKKYLNITMPDPWPLGRKYELVWVLVK